MEQRLIDADALCEEFKERQRAALRWKEKAILDGDEERQIRADATLAFLSEVKLTIDNAPTVSPDMAQVLAYESGKSSGRPHGKWIYHKDWYRDGECPWECSECGTCYDYDMNYCGECGADMRGDEV